MGTRGTVNYLAQHGIFMDTVKKVHDGSPNVIDMMRRDEVDLIINTPTSKMSRKDGYRIRRAAVDFKVPYITTIQPPAPVQKAMRANTIGKCPGAMTWPKL